MSASCSAWSRRSTIASSAAPRSFGALSRQRAMTSPTFRLLLGRTVAAPATALIPTTLTLAIVRATGSATDLGLVLSCELLPLLILLPVAGVIADRFPPQRVVLAADLVRAAAQLGIAAELLAGRVRIPDLAALSAITGAGVAFGTPAVRTWSRRWWRGPSGCGSTRGWG
jgi:MFS family permease